MKDWTTHFELDASGFRVEVVTPLESVEEQQYRERRAAKRKTRKAAWGLIDWRNLTTPDEDERLCNEPGYSESLYPFYY